MNKHANSSAKPSRRTQNGTQVQHQSVKPGGQKITLSDVVIWMMALGVALWFVVLIAAEAMPIR